MKPPEQVFGQLHALMDSPVETPTKALVLLHGVGSNEENLLELGRMITDDRLVVSLRAPLILGQKSFAWFNVDFTPNGPVHNWGEAEKSFKKIEEALEDISRKTGIPSKSISIFGFSQGSIMVIGLALRSKLALERYIASSGRTLPEFSEAALNSPLPETKNRRFFLSHGISDSKLPIHHAKNSEKVLRSAEVDLTYKEYPGDHGIAEALVIDLKRWMAQS
jgi:phospholipase/carboxylesterase